MRWSASDQSDPLAEPATPQWYHPQEQGIYEDIIASENVLFNSLSWPAIA